MAPIVEICFVWRLCETNITARAWSWQYNHHHAWHIGSQGLHPWSVGCQGHVVNKFAQLARAEMHLDYTLWRSGCTSGWGLESWGVWKCLLRGANKCIVAHEWEHMGSTSFWKQITDLQCFCFLHCYKYGPRLSDIHQFC